MKIILATLALVVAFAFANRGVELSGLDHLQALDASSLSGTKAALTWINEHALEHLPVAATLRAENVVAGVALRMAGQANTVAAR